MNNFIHMFNSLFTLADANVALSMCCSSKDLHSHFFNFFSAVFRQVVIPEEDVLLNTELIALVFNKKSISICLLENTN